MRIAVDARQLYRHDRRGIGKSLVQLFRVMAARRPTWEFHLFHRAGPTADPFPGVPNVFPRPIEIPAGDRFDLWEQVRLPLAAMMCRADVLHGPANTGPRFPLTPLVLTVHDLIPLEESPDEPGTRFWVRNVGRAARAAARVHTISGYSESQIVARLGVPPEKLTVAGWAADPGMSRVNDPDKLDAVRRKYGVAVGERFVFGFGAADPRKNTARIIDAFAGLPADVRGDVRLVLVGIVPAALTAFRVRADALGLGDRVRLHGYADEADLAPLMSAAALLAFPSRSEGYGLPVLDAFACGLPVVAGNRTSLPEVAGGAAVLVDPDDTSALREAMARVLADVNLRADLAARGRDRLESLTWDATAEEILDVYERVAHRGRR